MGGKLRITREWESCCSIVSLLLLLAHLAERAAGAPDPVRMGLMWALRGAVEVAGSFALRPTVSARPRLAFVTRLPEDTGSGAVDALNLAPALRALAVVVHAMAAHLRKQADLFSDLAPRGSAAAGSSATASTRHRALRPAFVDTS